MTKPRALLAAPAALVLILLTTASGQASASPDRTTAPAPAAAAAAANAVPSASKAQAQFSDKTPRCKGSSRDTVSRGSTGRSVAEVQCLLRTNWGYPLAIDGLFGPRTEVAVRRHQDDCDIAVDGIVGPVTWDRLDPDTTSRECADGNRD